MEHSDVLYLVVWFNVRLCLPLTILIIGLCLKARLQKAPVVFYLNLLISNLVQFGSMIFWISDQRDSDAPFLSLAVYYCGVLANLGFRICITLERHFVITYPKSWDTRKTKVHVLIGFVVWGLCGFLLSLLRFYEYVLPIFILVVFILALLSAPIIVFCLAKTIQSLPAAMSVPTEDRRRTVAVLVLLLVHHTEMILSTDAWSLLANISSYVSLSHSNVIIYTYLLNPFVDLILLVFMCDRPTDQMLEHLCNCRMENSESVAEELQQRE